MGKAQLIMTVEQKRSRYNIGMIMDQTRPESIANTMKCVYINREMLRLKDKNLKNFVEPYSWQAQERKLIGLYASVAA